jgi:hypothetical protein
MAHPLNELTQTHSQVDEFRVQCRQLGSLRAIRVESDCKSSKPNWHLDYVVIQVSSQQFYATVPGIQGVGAEGGGYLRITTCNAGT